MEKTTASINVRLPKDLYEELKSIADSNNVTLSSIIRMALSEYIKNQNK